MKRLNKNKLAKILTQVAGMIAAACLSRYSFFLWGDEIEEPLEIKNNK